MPDRNRGWAFTKTEAARDEEELHEEARRQARLLVTEIKLYHEEVVEEGRKSENIYDRLRDDIDRSRQIFEERIDPRLRDNVPDYFRQELIRILAGGDERLLAIELGPAERAADTRCYRETSPTNLDNTRSYRETSPTNLDNTRSYRETSPLALSRNDPGWLARKDPLPCSPDLTLL